MSDSSLPFSATKPEPASRSTSFVEEDEWDQFADADGALLINEEGSSIAFQEEMNFEESRALSSSTPRFQLPPHLHPAVSLGVRRVSSCYFSIGSQESQNSLADLLTSALEHESNASVSSEASPAGDSSLPTPEIPNSESTKRWGPSDLLYHDILTNVFQYLDAPSLAAFSETARRPNFEVFYYLQLQLQQSLLPPSQTTMPLTSIAGTACVSRLASLNPTEAQETIDTFLNSNSTLKTMPLSHSLMYLRHVLQRQAPPSAAPLASAALFMTVVGAALLSGGADVMVPVEAAAGELPNMLFGMGVMGSLMGAASTMNATKNNTAKNREQNLRDRAEQMRKAMQHFPAQLMEQMVQMRAGNKQPPESEGKEESSSITDPVPRTPNPYEHLPDGETVSDIDPARPSAPESQRDSAASDQSDRKMPSGCVGAYSRSIHTAATALTRIIKEQRKVKFDALSPEDKYALSSRVLDACTSNDHLDTLKLLMDRFDVDGFFLGADGTETCALHTAAFHGCDQIVDYLCRKTHSSDPELDGGCAKVQLIDPNGWTALHFAAGANSVAVAKVLIQYGADLSVEANNGYTPLQWAQRLSNDEVAEELLCQLQHQEASSSSWMAAQPLSAICHRFFSLIPVSS